MSVALYSSDAIIKPDNRVISRIGERKCTTKASQREERIIMKTLYLGMFAMVDLTAAVLAQSTDVLWDKHFYHSLIGSTLAVVVFGGVYPVADSVWLLRRSIAALAIGVAAGPFTASLSQQCFHIELNSMSVVFASAMWSLGGPFAVQRYGEKAIDKGAEYLHLKNGSTEQHSIETPDNRNDDTVNGK